MDCIGRSTIDQDLPELGNGSQKSSLSVLLTRTGKYTKEWVFLRLGPKECTVNDFLFFHSRSCLWYLGTPIPNLQCIVKMSKVTRFCSVSRSSSSPSLCLRWRTILFVVSRWRFPVHKSLPSWRRPVENVYDIWCQYII